MAVSVGDILDASVVEHAHFGTWVRLPDDTRALLELPFIAKGKEEVAEFQREHDRGSTVPVVVILIDDDGEPDEARVAVSMLDEHFDIGDRWQAAKKRWPVGSRAAAEVKLIALGKVFIDMGEDFLGVIRSHEDRDGVERLATMLGATPHRPAEQRVMVEVIGHDDRRAEFRLLFKRFIGRKKPTASRGADGPHEQLELVFPE